VNMMSTDLASPARRRLCAGLAVGLLPLAARAIRPPQDVAALPTSMAASHPLLAIACAGARIVAAGQRGHIVYSDDDGAHWTQAAVPVSSDLLALSFPSARRGWAVGHGGVVLHSDDGGATWRRQLGGREANELALRHFESRAAVDPRAAALLQREKAQGADGSTPSFLDVHFSSETSGFVVGTFNRILRTDDGGKTCKDSETNVKSNLFAIAVAARDDVLIAGDQGLVLATNDGGATWQTQTTLTSSALYGVAYRGGSNAWIAGRGGAILRRTTDLATVKINMPKIGPIGREAPKLKDQENIPQLNFDNDDIPKAVPPVRKPIKPSAN